MIYNPSPDDFFEWMAAAERETWKYIPRIKCHIAEEIALDQCVQRLRHRLILESQAKRRQSASTHNMIGNGLPSFFVSPSLSKLPVDSTSNTSATDLQSSAVEQFLQQSQKDEPSRSYNVPLKDSSLASHGASGTLAQTTNSSPWAVHGLHGNHHPSGGNLLARDTSHSSGLFIDDEENPQQPPVFAGGSAAPLPLGSTNSLCSNHRNVSHNSMGSAGSMAQFYYRRASESNLAGRLPSTAKK